MQSQQQNHLPLDTGPILEEEEKKKKSGGDFGVFAPNQNNRTVIYTLQSQVAR